LLVAVGIGFVVNTELLTAAKDELEGVNSAPAFHTVKGLQKKVALGEGPLIGPIPGSLVVLPAVVHPDVLGKELGRGFVSSEDVRDDLAPVHAIWRRSHPAWCREFARRILLLVFWLRDFPSLSVSGRSVVAWSRGCGWHRAVLVDKWRRYV
jgi:hypothetical protein